MTKVCPFDLDSKTHKKTELFVIFLNPSSTKPLIQANKQSCKLTKILTWETSLCGGLVPWFSTMSQPLFCSFFSLLISSSILFLKDGCRNCLQRKSSTYLSEIQQIQRISWQLMKSNMKIPKKWNSLSNKHFWFYSNLAQKNAQKFAIFRFSGHFLCWI